MKVIVVGGGIAGFSAASVAAAAGAEVTLIERTDRLGGLGAMGGIGLVGYWHTVVGQETALGGGAIIDVFKTISIHEHTDTPVYKDVLLYDVNRLDDAMQASLKALGVELLLNSRVTGIELSGNAIEMVILADGSRKKGEVLVDATGTAGGVGACQKYGYGCVECTLRCPEFGNPGGLAEKYREATIYDRRAGDGKPGVLGTPVLIRKTGLPDDRQLELKQSGFTMIPVPPGIDTDLARYIRSDVSTGSLMDENITKLNILLLDVGDYARVTGAGAALYAGSLQKVPGLERSVIAQPKGGATSHLVHGLGIAVRDNTMKIAGFNNLFCAGTKSGIMLSFIDAMITGDLAGLNAVRQAKGMCLMELPEKLAAGAYINYAGKSRQDMKYGYQSSVQSDLLKGFNVYREGDAIMDEVDKAGMCNVYRSKIS